MRRRLSVVLGIAALSAAAAAPDAGAAMASVDIGSPSGPLTHVAVGTDLSCQIQHTGDTSLEFYPSGATPGDCGRDLPRRRQPDRRSCRAVASP